MNLEAIKLTDFLTKTIHCSCGRTHSFKMKAIEISTGALHTVPIVTLMEQPEKISSQFLMRLALLIRLLC